MTKTVLVTGANRGLGFETCRQLAAAGFTVLLTARKAQAGEEAAAALRAQELDVRFLALDVALDASIRQAAEFLRQHDIRLDVLVNNAGVFLDPGPDQEESSVFFTGRDTLRSTMEVNVYGPVCLVQALRPSLKSGGRIINVSSGMGQLSEMNGGCPAYRISKTALNAVTRILSQELAPANISVNSVCPGWVKTDMGGSNALLSPAQGVDTMVWLATADDSPSGCFFRERRPIAW